MLVITGAASSDNGLYDCVATGTCPPGFPLPTSASAAASLLVYSADFNHDGRSTSQDFFDFLTAFFTDAPAADFNHDSIINSQDVFDFLAAFFTGC